MIFCIMLFAASVVATILFFWMAATGVRRRQVYYEPSCPPIAFSTRPLAFIALCVFYVALGFLFLIFTVGSGWRLWKMI